MFRKKVSSRSIMWNFKKVREMEYNEKKIKETQGTYYTQSLV